MLNSVQLIGNLGSKPELKYTKTGLTFVSFSVATTENYTKDGQKLSNTEWHNIDAWGRLAETAAAYLNKGSKVFVQGKLKTETYEKMGEKRYITKIVANRVIFLDPKQESNDNPYSDKQVQQKPVQDDDIPF